MNIVLVIVNMESNKINKFVFGINIFIFLLDSIQLHATEKRPCEKEFDPRYILILFVIIPKVISTGYCLLIILKASESIYIRIS